MYKECLIFFQQNRTSKVTKLEIFGIYIWISHLNFITRKHLGEISSPQFYSDAIVNDATRSFTVYDRGSCGRHQRLENFAPRQLREKILRRDHADIRGFNTEGEYSQKNGPDIKTRRCEG